MRASSVLLSAFAPAIVLVACSSDSTSGSSSSGSNSGGTSKYTCSVNNITYDCPDQASLDKCGDLKNPDPSDCKQRSSSPGGSSGSTSSSGSSGDTCKLFACTTQDDCGVIAPCMKSDTGASYCYEQEANASQCSAGATPTTAMVSGSSRTLCVPSGCPTPTEQVQ